MKANHIKNQIIGDALKQLGFTDHSGVSANYPHTAADAVIEEILGKRAALSAGKKPVRRVSRKSKDEKEREKAEEERIRHSKSLTQIAEALHCEGFNEFAAYGVLTYARARLWGAEWGDEAHERRSKMAEAFRDLSDDQRKAAGNFIHFQASASFEAGLRIGLMASLWTLMLATERKP